ncbi:glycine cleavage system protein GcvH [Candidatus Poribacteria bacterium]|nr:glycine cleavage system protein GcvH [Candidatus Poribacteria bacterium]
MHFPDKLKYTKEHTWVSVKKNIATFGITDFAQKELGEIVFIELPEPGSEVTHMSEFGVIESSKTSSDLYAPVSGEVIDINEELFDNPDTINRDPYHDGWMITVKMSDPSELNLLISAEEYSELVKEENDGDEDE